MASWIDRLFGSGEEAPKAEGREGIATLGHREYVGGMWDEIGALQFEFLLQQGLQPEHCLVDVACGALRGGVHFIRYLAAGCYLGLDKEAELVEKGINEELGREMFEEKCPEFVISDSFEFERFSRKPDFGIAQSLFSHLSDRDARLCLSKLRQFVNDGHRLFVTFFEGDSSQNPTASHSHARFMYSREEMEAMGRECGWRPDYLGDWKHPRNQMMIRFVAE